MNVARITLWDGRVFHTDRCDREHLEAFFRRVKEKADRQGAAPSWPVNNQLDLLEMTADEYAALPVNPEAAELFA